MNTVATRIAIALNNLKSDEKAQTMAEYGIVMGVIGIVAIVGASALGNGLNDAFNAILAELPGFIAGC